MTERLTTAEGVLEVLGTIDREKIRWELTKLRGIRDWAMKNLGVDYVVGDRVVLTRSLGRDRSSGWYPYREALAEGATAVVKKIDFSPGRSDSVGSWFVDIMLDREWSVHEWTGMPGQGEDRRYWNGPKDECPEGMKPAYGMGERRHLFMVDVTDVHKAPPPAPETCDCCGQAVPE